MTALTGMELVARVERTSDGWRTLMAKHPQLPQVPCDIRETRTAGELLQHIVHTGTSARHPVGLGYRLPVHGC